LQLKSLYVVANISKSKNESKSQRRRLCVKHIHVVANISKSKNESKSQLSQTPSQNDDVVANISKSKNESKSQHPRSFEIMKPSCCKYQQIKE
jgi:hypothetical protein